MPQLRFETERLIIRPYHVDDAQKYHDWDSDPELAYLSDDESDDYEPISLKRAGVYLQAMSAHDLRHDSLHFAIEVKAAGALIGFCMAAEIEPQHRRCKVGITIGERSEWGKGYAREALIPVIDYCFTGLGLNRVIAEIYCINERSRRLFAGLGFTHEGTLRQSVWKQGEALDDCLYALLREDWRGELPG